MEFNPTYYLEQGDIILMVEKTAQTITERGTVKSSEFLFHFQKGEVYYKLLFKTEQALFISKLLEYAMDFAFNNVINSSSPTRHYKIRLEHEKLNSLTIEAVSGSITLRLMGLGENVEIVIPAYEIAWLSEVLRFEALNEYSNLTNTQQELYHTIKTKAKKKEQIDTLEGREYG